MKNPKWKEYERELARALQNAAGKCTHPALAPLVSSTGRLGHLPNLQIDAAVGDKDFGTFVIVEAKRVKLPATFIPFLKQIVDRAYSFGAHPVLSFKFSDEVAKAKRSERLTSCDDFSIIESSYLAELLESRRILAALFDGTIPNNSTLFPYTLGYCRELLKEVEGDEVSD